LQGKRNSKIRVSERACIRVRIRDKGKSTRQYAYGKSKSKLRLVEQECEPMHEPSQGTSVVSTSPKAERVDVDCHRHTAWSERLLRKQYLHSLSLLVVPLCECLPACLLACPLAYLPSYLLLAYLLARCLLACSLTCYRLTYLPTNPCCY
jgi:hypothetical protein